MARSRLPVAAFMLLAAGVHAQWFATELDGGDATALDGSQIAGRTSTFNALVWSSPAVPTPLQPKPATQSVAFDVHGGSQVGRALIGGANHASLWFGSPGSWVDLHPAGASVSIANAVYDGQQVGYAVFGGVQHAGLWTGTASSWTDLNPLGATRSFAEGVVEGSQVGSAMFGGIYHAGTWAGTPLSWNDIHPAGATESVAYDLDVGNPVGFARLGNKHAVTWQGSSGAYTDLNPAGATESVAYGASGGSQAGFAVIDGITSACVWQGSAGTHFSLQPFVDPRFTESAASDIHKDFDSGFTYVVGRAWNAGEAKAMLWTLPPHEIEPSALTVLRGSAVVGDLESIRLSDESRLRVNPGVVLSNSQSPVILDIVGISPNPVISHLRMFVEISASTPNAQATIALFDYQAGHFETLTSFPSPVTDTTYEFNPSSPRRFVSPTGEIKCRISWRLTGPILNYPWATRTDWVHWRVVE